LNTYALFAENFRNLISGNKARSGIIVPTGIATDDSTKYFFSDLVEKHQVTHFLDFENREAIFLGVHRNYKFCLLTISNAPVQTVDLVFFATDTGQLHDSIRRISLNLDDVFLFNPNTRTMPIFRTKIDAELTRKIYKRVPIMIDERSDKNRWGIMFKQGLFNMTTDSKLFSTKPIHGYLRLYEGKFINQFDHRHATCKTQEAIRGNRADSVSDDLHANPNFFIKPRYWAPKPEVENRLRDWGHDWLLGFRDVTRAVDLRSCWFSFLPRVAVGHTLPLVFSKETNTKLVACLMANLNSFVVDYVARQKIGGIHLTYSYLKQFPVLLPSDYTHTDIGFIASRVLELVYTAFDLKPLAEDMGYHGEPYRWDDERRALLRAELDAYYAKLYGLTRDELRYILDPQDVYGPDFPGETFRVLKDKEIKQYGEYRTRRLVLEAWDRLEGVYSRGSTGSNF
jgi:hypothetical protein